MSAVCVGPMWVLYHLKEYRGEIKGQGNYIQINLTNKDWIHVAYFSHQTSIQLFKMLR